MLEQIADPQAAAVYGRQIPRPNAPIDEVARLAIDFPADEQSMTGLVPSRAPNGNLRFLSNACAVIRRSAWEKVKFDEQSAGAEEQIWMEELLREGYVYSYASAAMAYHSHRDPIGRGAYRLWELHRERLARRGQLPSIGKAAYEAGAFCKRRLKNVATTNSSIISKLEGVIRLPLEVAGFLLSGILEGMGMDRRKVRNLMWR
jgi:rhamnosyltransferase